MFIVGVDVGSKHLALCRIFSDDPPGRPWTITHWVVISSDGTTAADVHACLQKNDVSSWFDKDGGEGVVVIERQPLKNPTMTRIQHYLEMYCAVHAAPCVVQDAKVKLMYAATTAWWPRDLASDGEWTYSRRKKLAVETVRAYVTAATTGPDPTLTTMFLETKKKDDYADAFLHAMAYASRLAAAPGRSRRTAKKKKLVAREPTTNQRASGTLSPSNVKWLLRGAGTPDAVADAIRATMPPKLKNALTRALKKHFGSVDAFLEALTVG